MREIVCKNFHFVKKISKKSIELIKNRYIINVYRRRGIVLAQVFKASLVGESRQEISKEALLRDTVLNLVGMVVKPR